MDNPEKKIWSAPEIVDLDVNLDTAYGGNVGNTEGPDDFTANTTTVS